VPNLQLEEHASYGHLLGAPISLMRWDPDGKHLGIVSNKVFHRWKYRSKGDFVFQKRIRGTEETVDLNLTHSHIVSVFRENQVSVQRLGQGYVPIPWRRYHEKFKQLAWSPDQDYIAANTTYELVVFTVATRQPMRLSRRIQTDTPINAICWSPDAKYVVACTQGRAVHIVNVATRRVVAVFRHTSPILQVAISRDNKYLVIGSINCTVTIYDLETINQNPIPVITLPNTGAVAKSFDFSRDNTLLAAQLDNEYVYVWSLKTQKLVDIIHNQCDRSNGLAFHPIRDKLAISVNIDGGNTFRIYKIPSNIHECKPKVEIIKKRVAKIMIVGDRYVGKSSVFKHLISKQPNDRIQDNIAVIPDDNAMAAPDGELGTQLEMWLWDSPPSPDTRLLSELELRNITLALIVFDGSRDTFKQSIHHWLKRLIRIQQNFDTQSCAILVESQTYESLSNVLKDGVIQTDMTYRNLIKVDSQGNGADLLLDEIFKAINWEQIQEGVYTSQFEEIREFLFQLSDNDRFMLMSISQLFNRYRNTLDQETLRTEEEIYQEFEGCIIFLELQGILRRFRYGGLILLQPGVLTKYISSILDYISEHDEFGAITIQDILTIDFEVEPEYRLDNQYLENALRIAIVDDLLANDIAYREGDILHFPHMYQSSVSNINLDKLEPDYEYDVDEPIAIVYSQIVNRLRLLPEWELEGIGQEKTLFSTPEGESFVISHETSDYSGKLSLAFDAGTHKSSRCLIDLVIRLYLQELTFNADVVKTPIYHCKNCGRRLSPAQSRAINTFRATQSDISCIACGHNIRVVDDCRGRELDERLREQYAEMSVTLMEAREQRMKKILFQNKVRLDMYDAIFVLDQGDKVYVQHNIHTYLQKEYAILAKIETRLLPAIDIMHLRNYDERVVYFLGSKPLTADNRAEILRLAETIGTVNRKIILMLLGSGMRAEELYQHKHIELMIMFDEREQQLNVLNKLARELITVL